MDLTFVLCVRSGTMSYLCPNVRVVDDDDDLQSTRILLCGTRREVIRES
jgi:hypothetical protein